MLFLLLIIVSLSLTIQSHSFHKSKVISSANFLSGGVYEKMNNINEYFNLKIQNDELAKENARLKSLLFNIKDTTKLPKVDSIYGVKKIDIIISKVALSIALTSSLPGSLVDHFDAGQLALANIDFAGI